MVVDVYRRRREPRHHCYLSLTLSSLPLSSLTPSLVILTSCRRRKRDKRQMCGSVGEARRCSDQTGERWGTGR
ncbi:hypothetical protein Hanom_Chr00s102453g01804441 [Helianthus anomalus]